MALSLSELQLIESLEKNLRSCMASNSQKYKYYYGHLAVKDLGISTPARLRGLNTALGWGTSAVDVLEERMVFSGFYSPSEDVEHLNEQFRENFLAVNQKPIQKDSLITGASYISIAPGNRDLGETEIMYRPESPSHIYGEYNSRTMKLNNALKMVRSGDVVKAVLWLPYATIELIKDLKLNKWFEVDRDEHNLGFVPVVQVSNNADSMYPRGRSEITQALRGFIDSGMRTLLGTEVAREFFARPLRAMVGADQGDFIDADGVPTNPYNVKAGGLLNVPYNSQDALLPSLIQLPPSNPENILNLLEPLARLAAREIGVPPSYFGFETVNPSSADAINEADKKLVNKVYSRLPEQKKAWKQAFEYGEIIRTGELTFEDWVNVEAVYERPETPTPAAAADRITKMISSGVFSQNLPDFVYRELGLKELEILQLKEFLQNNEGNALINSLIEQNTETVGE